MDLYPAPIPTTPHPSTGTPKASQAYVAPMRFAAADRYQPQTQNVRTKTPKFGGGRYYNGPFDGINFFTDFNDGTSNAESLSRLHDTLEFTIKNRPLISRHLGNFQKNGTPLKKNYSKKPLARLKKIAERFRQLLRQIGSFITGNAGFLDVKTFDDIPYGNIDYANLSIQRLAARPNKNITVHVVDPGVGNNTRPDGSQLHDRSILITKNHGVLIGPNNGSLGLFVNTLTQAGEPWQLLPIDLKQVQELERLRRNDPDYALPETFHARDAFAMVAAAIAGGIDPLLLSDQSREEKDFELRTTAFADTIQPLPLEDNKPVEFYAFEDRTFGNAKTNLTLTPEEQKDLVREESVFNINTPDGTLNKGKGYNIPFHSSFSQASDAYDQRLLYLGSSHNNGNKRFVELAINMGNISEVLGLDLKGATKLTIQRLQ